MPMTSSLHGLLVVDKPTGITSRDAVDRAQPWFGRRVKLGHTGTLDPLATGVLVLTVGQATRLSEYVQRMRKTYRTRIRFGGTSSSDDADGTIVLREGAVPPERAAVERALLEFIGDLTQLPPAFSALRLAGKRAWELARRGVEVSLPPRQVTVYAIQILNYEYPLLELEVVCGKGTYIRSLARDLGEVLGCGGYVTDLHRARVGPFVACHALSLDADRPTALARLLPMSAALADLPRVTIPFAAAQRFCSGMRLAWDSVGVVAPELADCSEAAIFTTEGQFLAVATIEHKRRLLKPEKVFARPERSPVEQRQAGPAE